METSLRRSAHAHPIRTADPRLAPGAPAAPGRSHAAPDLWNQPRNADGSYVAIARESLASLTSLRFFAAAYVVLHHLVNIGLLHAQGAGADRQATWYLSLATQGHVGVTFFFVLSGFILAWCYHASFARSGAAEPGERRRARRTTFWFARFARVWPLHAATFALFVPIVLVDALSPSGLVRSAWTGAANLTLLHAWIPFGGPDGIADTFNAPSWTLSCEALFYVAFPALAVLFVARLRWGIAQLATVGFVAWLALGSLGLLAGSSDTATWVMAKFPPTRFADFLIGVCAGLIVVQLRQHAVLAGRSRPARTEAAWTAAELAAILAALAGPVVVAFTHGALVNEHLAVSWLHLPAFTALIVVMAMERGAISRRLFAARPLIWLGEASYALYLTHMLLILAAFKFGAYAVLGPWVASAALFVAAIVVAGVVHERFEKPARTRLVEWRATHS